MRSVALITLVCLVAIAPAARAQREKFSPDDLDYIQKTWPQLEKTNTGIRYLIEHPGQGQPPKPGDKVSVLFIGTLLQGKLFEKNMDAHSPYQFRLGRGEVIPGWDQVLQLMKPGSTWMVIIPPELAYGSRGRPPRVPSGATLVFTVQLLSVLPQD